jgi:hypothetical protein
MKLHKERSNGIKSGDTDGHENVPQRPIHMQGNAHQESWLLEQYPMEDEIWKYKINQSCWERIMQFLFTDLMKVT